MTTFFLFLLSTCRTITRIRLEILRVPSRLAGKSWENFVEIIAGRTVSWTCDTKPEYGIVVVQTHLCMEEYGVVEKDKKTLNMMILDPNNHTRWKHKLEWHNRGCVWDKVASEWAVAEDWSEK